MVLAILIVVVLNFLTTVIVSVYLLSQKSSNRTRGASGSETVFCSKCCQSFDASLRNCPKCGAPNKR